MKALSRFAPLVLALFLPTTPVIADQTRDMLLEGGRNALIYNIDSFKILLSDQVVDGCLASPARISDAMEVSLRQAGFKIQNDNPLATYVNITVLGYMSGGICFVSHSVDIDTLRLMVLPLEDFHSTLATHSLRIDYGVVSGRASHTQSSLEDVARKSGEKIYLMISRAKDEMRENFPEIYAKPSQSVD